MSDSQHTPTPWSIVETSRFAPEDWEGLNIEAEGSNTVICQLAGGLPFWEIMENARLIVRAVNSYKEIIEAAMLVIDSAYRSDAHDGDVVVSVVQLSKLEEAIRKAKGETT